MGYRLRSTDLILKHLIVANSLVLLCKGVPHTMAMFGWKHIRSDVGCKLLFFLHRVGRGVFISSICLLSVFQVITNGPWNSRWAALKVTASKYIVSSIFLCWILQMLVNVIFPIYITGKWSDNNITEERDYGCCSTILTDQKNRKTRHALYAVLLSFCDVYVWGSHSGLAAPWFSSCTDISSRSSTFVGPMPPPDLPLSPELLKPSFSWGAPLSTFILFPPSFKIFWLFWSVQLVPCEHECNHSSMLPSCQPLSAHELWLQCMQALLCLDKKYRILYY